MTILTGDTRHVVVFPTLGFVLKFPRIYVRSAVLVLWRMVMRGAFRRQLYHEVRIFTVDSMGSLKWQLFRGLRDNWSEFRFYLTTTHPILTPTFFSAFGFVNVQRFGEPIRESPYDQCAKVMGSEAISDAHHLENPNNFSRHQGKFRVLDYGSPKTQAWIIRHGYVIYDRLSDNGSLSR